MPKNPESLLYRLAQKRMVSAWARFAAQSKEMPLTALRVLQNRAHQLREPLDAVIQAADLRLTRPRPGAQAMTDKPAGTDWTWRPEAWCQPLRPHAQVGMAPRDRVGSQMSLFHDCPLRELTIRQIRNRRDADLAPFSVRLESYGFEGSFLSLALDLPESAHADIARNHVFRLTVLAKTERPMEVFARLNLRNGPNTAQQTSELAVQAGQTWQEARAEFDLAYANFNENRVQQVWLDLIFDKVTMNQIQLRDLVVARYLRADL